MKQREIKFKYWNSQKKGMYYKDTWNDFPLKVDENDVWLEYTGLKDKSGVEIWQGDIVRMNKKNYEMKWSDLLLGFQLKELSDNPQKWVSFSTAKIEVIGNIYENPELLTLITYLNNIKG